MFEKSHIKKEATKKPEIIEAKSRNNQDEKLKQEQTKKIETKSKNSQAKKTKIKKIPVYHGPGEYMGVAGHIPEGKKIVLTGRKQADWIEITLGKKKYWLRENNLKNFEYTAPNGFLERDFNERTDSRRKQFFNESQQVTARTDSTQHKKKTKYFVDLDVRKVLSKAKHNVFLRLELKNKGNDPIRNLKIKYWIYAARSKDSDLIVRARDTIVINKPLLNFQIGVPEIKLTTKKVSLKDWRGRYYIYYKYKGFIVKVYTGNELLIEEKSHGLRDIEP